MNFETVLRRRLDGLKIFDGLVRISAVLPLCHLFVLVSL